MYFLMIPLTTLYDEYIDRPKLSEQKKPVEYIVHPSPLKWESEQKPLILHTLYHIAQLMVNFKCWYVPGAPSNILRYTDFCCMFFLLFWLVQYLSFSGLLLVFRCNFSCNCLSADHMSFCPQKRDKQAKSRGLYFAEQPYSRFTRLALYSLLVCNSNKAAEI